MSNSKGMKATLNVKSKQYLTPHFIRITLTGEEVPAFARATVGDNNKILIPPPGVDKIYYPTYNEEQGEWNHPPEEVRPSVRTYTHRGIDIDKKEMIIDFVAHGDAGPASQWAINAKPGDVLGVMMRARPKQLVPEVDWYLLAGDATAIPVLSIILERLPPKAKGVACIEVRGKEDEQVLTTASDLSIRWVHNNKPGRQEVLAEKIRSLAKLPSDPTVTKFAYVAAEFSSVRAIRSYLRKDEHWEPDELYAYSYWKYGKAEDQSAKKRREESHTKK